MWIRWIINRLNFVFVEVPKKMGKAGIGKPKF